MDSFKQLTEDQTDPSTPIFWETVHWLAKQGSDIKSPQVDLPPPSLGVMALELKRSIALQTPTMALPIMEVRPDAAQAP